MGDWIYTVATAADVSELTSKVNDLSGEGYEIVQVIHQPRPEAAGGSYIRPQADAYLLLIRHSR
jgi:hypothetical protein